MRCISKGGISQLAKYISAENIDAAVIRNYFCCEAHNELLTADSAIIFEKRADAAREFCSDIEKLQEMQIPESLM